MTAWSSPARHSGQNTYGKHLFRAHRWTHNEDGEVVLVLDLGKHTCRAHCDSSINYKQVKLVEDATHDGEEDESVSPSRRWWLCEGCYLFGMINGTIAIAIYLVTESVVEMNFTTCRHGLSIYIYFTQWFTLSQAFQETLFYLWFLQYMRARYVNSIFVWIDDQ